MKIKLKMHLVVGILVIFGNLPIIIKKVYISTNSTNTFEFNNKKEYKLTKFQKEALGSYK
jgi:hypothetical protein